MSETQHEAPESFVSRTARIGAIALIPISILLGDLEFRWIQERAVEPIAFIGWFSASVILSMLLWWGLGTAVRGRKARYWFLPATVLPLGVLVVASWRFRTVRHFDPAAIVVTFILDEPIYSLELASGGISPSWLAAIILLPLGWLALTLYYASQDPVSTPIRATAVASVVAVPLLVWTGFPSISENPWTPYPTDIRLLKVTEQGVSYYARGISSMKIRPTERETPPQSEQQGGPSVLVILGESVRNDRTTLWGEPGRATMPRMQALADERPDEVFAFQRHTASTSATFASGVGIFLGKHFSHEVSLLRRIPTIWQYADAVGLETFLVSAQPWTWGHLREFYIQNQPPDHFWDAREMGLAAVNDAGGDDLEAADKVVELIEGELEPDQPFFGIFQLNATHFPFYPLRDVGWPVDTPTDRYDAAMARSDAAIGRVLDALERSGRLDSTIVVFVSDHAIELDRGDHESGHSKMRASDPGLFQGARISSCEPVFLRTPLMLFVPEPLQERLGIDREVLRQNTSRLSSHVDILPTVTEIWRARVDLPLDGVSLLQPVERDRIVYCYPGTRVNSLAGVGILSGQNYVYMRANLQRPHAYDVTDPSTYSRRSVGEPLDSADKALIQRACDDSAQARQSINMVSEQADLVSCGEKGRESR